MIIRKERKCLYFGETNAIPNFWTFTVLSSMTMNTIAYTLSIFCYLTMTLLSNKREFCLKDLNHRMVLFILKIFRTHSFVRTAKLKVLKNGVTEDLIKVFRAITISADEISTEIMVTGVPNEPISIRSEGSIYQALVDACRNSLKQYQTSIEEDEKILADPNISLRKRMMVKIRKAEKEMLFKVGVSAQAKVKVLHEQYLEEKRSDKKDKL